MRVFCRHSLLRVSCFLLLSKMCAAAVAPAQDPRIQTSSSPQIVRLSYVEGDVRLARGKHGDKADAAVNETATGWEEASANVPIESGYSLVTGKGRAEIEFEDASVVYVDQNSVINFVQLTATSGVPYTEISLLSGRASLNVRIEFPSEEFWLDTPTDRVEMQYPQRAYIRVDSYLDSLALTPLATDTGLLNEDSYVPVTRYYYQGVRQILPSGVNAADARQWDAWVDKRVKTRDAATAATMKEAGLHQPIPGLAEMNGQGQFFECAPYGTCWEPKDGWGGHLENVSETSVRRSDVVVPVETGGSVQAAQAKAVKVVASSGKIAKPSAVDVYLQAHPGATVRTEEDYVPCTDVSARNTIALDPATGKEKVIDTFLHFAIAGSDPGPGMPFFHGGGGPGLYMMSGWGRRPWYWAVCHTGTWIRWRRHYVWVAGEHRHHHGPYRWVKRGRDIGFVPMHPHDVTGKPPINMKNGLLKWTGKREAPAERIVESDGEGKEVKVLSGPPKEYLKAALEPLKTAAVPVAQAYSVYSGAAETRMPTMGKPVAGLLNGASLASMAAGKNASTDARRQGSAITFDRKSQSFTVVRQDNEGGRTTYVSAGFNSRDMSRQNNDATYAGHPSGSNGSSTGSSRSYPPSNASNNGVARSYSPSQSSSNSNSSRSYSQPPSYNSSASSYHPSAPPPPPPPPPSPPPASSSNAGASQPARH